MKFKRSFLLPLAVVFVLCNVCFIAAAALFTKWGIDSSILMIANSLFLILTLITFFVQQKALLNTNPNVFIRSVMAGMMIKMFSCIIAIIIYWFIMREKFSNPTVLAAMLIYLVYLAVEVTLVTKLNRKKNG